MEKDDCVGEVVRYMSKKGGLAINPKDFNSAEVTEAYLNSLNKNKTNGQNLDFLWQVLVFQMIIFV